MEKIKPMEKAPNAAPKVAPRVQPIDIPLSKVLRAADISDDVATIDIP
ncbi:hypothetical protein [Endozoicomonas sp. ALC066]